jgi:hypothetical protein
MGNVISIRDYLESKKNLEKWGGVIVLRVLEEIKESKSVGHILEIYPGNRYEETLEIVKEISPKIQSKNYLMKVVRQEGKEIFAILPFEEKKHIKITVY